MSGNQALRWCFTYNNATDGWRPVFNPQEMHYLVWELEEGEETHRKHIQGYLRLKNRKRINQVKALLGQNSIHLETARGNEQSNREYCSKDRKGQDWGEEGVYDAKAGQGKRNDLEEIATKIKNGVCLREIAENHPGDWIRYHGGILSLHSTLSALPPLRREVHVTVLWGASGTGKTHRVRTMYPDAIIISAGRDPFSKYTNEETICFDEFNDCLWKLQDMNRYLDVWRCQLDCRYQDKYAAWKRVFIISNTNPDRWFSMYEPELRTAFFRRIEKTIKITHKEQIIEDFY